MGRTIITDFMKPLKNNGKNGDRAEIRTLDLLIKSRITVRFIKSYDRLKALQATEI